MSVCHFNQYVYSAHLLANLYLKNICLLGKKFTYKVTKLLKLQMLTNSRGVGLFVQSHFPTSEICYKVILLQVVSLLLKATCYMYIIQQPSIISRNLPVSIINSIKVHIL